MTMRGLVALGLVLSAMAGGCLERSSPGPPDRATGDAESPTALDYYLKPGHRLHTSGPSSSAPVAEPAAPTANAYANEDVESWQAEPAGGWHVTSARLTVYYAVTTPTLDPFRNDSDPTQARHFVFWLGSNAIYAHDASAWGPALLVPGTTYQAEVRFAVPAAGWVVPPGESLMLLVAPLLVNTDPAVLHYLIDSAATPSAVHLETRRSTLREPTNATSTVHPFAVTGNSGAFTGLLPEEASVARVPIDVSNRTAFLKVEVRWKSTAAGKSDLDLFVRTASGDLVASSTTPFQNESVRLFAPQPFFVDGGRVTAEINVYSGALTTFDVVVTTWDRP